MKWWHIDKKQSLGYYNDRKNKKDIIYIDTKEGRSFLSNVQTALFDNYVISEEDATNILLSLNAEDFSHLLRNEHAGYDYEILYVFGKKYELLKRYEEENVALELYIKFNKIVVPFETLIVISFHVEEYTLNYSFKS